MSQRTNRAILKCEEYGDHGRVVEEFASHQIIDFGSGSPEVVGTASRPDFARLFQAAPNLQRFAREILRRLAADPITLYDGDNAITLLVRETRELLESLE